MTAVGAVVAAHAGAVAAAAAHAAEIVETAAIAVTVALATVIVVGAAAGTAQVVEDSAGAEGETWRPVAAALRSVALAADGFGARTKATVVRLHLRLRHAAGSAHPASTTSRNAQRIVHNTPLRSEAGCFLARCRI
jgi:hypothetical protein